MEDNKSKRILLMSKLVKLMDDWNRIYRREKRVTKRNFEKLINGAREITEYSKKLELLCNPPIDDLDIKLLNWAREKKVKYETLAFDIEVVCKRMNKLNDELLMVKIDNEKSKSFLYIIFEGSENKKIARHQMDLFYHLYKKFNDYTNENGYCDIVSFLNYVEEEIKPRFLHPFTYALIPEGDKNVSEELLRETLGRELNSEKLKEAYFSKEIKRTNSFPVFRIRVEEKRSDEEMVERGYFYTDPRYYKGEIEGLYAK